MTPAIPDSLRALLLRALQYVEECRLVMSWIDLLDIAFIGALLAVGFAWLRLRAARAILFALVPLLVTFAAAHSLKMYMTSVLFQFGLTAVFVTIIVTFQDDFRRAFESLANWRPWGRSRKINVVRLADILVEATDTFAKNRIGALIVLQGRQPVEPLLRAGIALNGTLSTPLLLSIFDPGSPGHDGAVTIAEGRVALFGAHLPLSRNAGATGRLGTRHAAALGLAERCDALVLVVSEETGTTSFAREGKLLPFKSAAEMRDLLQRHFRRVGPATIHRSLWEIPWMRLTGSFTLATALWLVFARPVNLVLRTMDAAIVYRGLPKGWEAKPPEPAKVKLTLFGPEGPLMLLDPTTLAISVDLMGIAEGQQTFVLGEGGVNLPARVRIKRVEPPEIVVQAYQTVDVEVPVTATWLEIVGRVPSSDELRVEPARVTLKIPRSSARPAALRTEPIDARELRRLGRLKAKLRAPEEAPAAELSTSEVEITLSSR